MDPFGQFQRTSSVENVWHHVARVIVANLLWPALAFAVAGWAGVWTWISGVFLFTFVVRDFNFRGHSSLTGTNNHKRPVNQIIHGLIAGEWHENHHDHPHLARSGFAWWQVDLPYWIIKAMKWVGIVTSYNSMETANLARHSELGFT